MIGQKNAGIQYGPRYVKEKQFLYLAMQSPVQ